MPDPCALTRLLIASNTSCTIRRMRTLPMVLIGLSFIVLGCSKTSEGDNANRENNAAVEKPGATPKAKEAPVAKDEPASKNTLAPASDKGAPIKGSGGTGERVSTGLTIVDGFAGVDPETKAFIHIAGEVKNETGGWVSHVKLDLELLDSDGKPILVTGISQGVKEDIGLDANAPETILGDRMYVPPGESTSFFYIRDVAKLSGKKYGRHTLKASARKEANAPKVTVADFKYTEAKDFFETLSGTLVVESGECRSPEPVFVSLTADGKIRSTTHHSVDSHFQKIATAGTKVPFERKVLSTSGATKLIAYATCSPEE